MNLILKLFGSKWRFKWNFGFYKELPNKAFRCYYDTYTPVATLFVSKKKRCMMCGFSSTAAFCDLNRANGNIPPCNKLLRDDKYNVFYMPSTW